MKSLEEFEKEANCSKIEMSQDSFAPSDVTLPHNYQLAMTSKQNLRYRRGQEPVM